jgi:hypothetical protein
MKRKTGRWGASEDWATQWEMPRKLGYWLKASSIEDRAMNDTRQCLWFRTNQQESELVAGPRTKTFQIQEWSVALQSVMMVWGDVRRRERSLVDWSAGEVIPRQMICPFFLHFEIYECVESKGCVLSNWTTRQGSEFKIRICFWPLRCLEFIQLRKGTSD